METIGIPELLIILVIVILVFGIGRISKIGAELGGGIRAFREGLRGDETPAAQQIGAAAASIQPAQPAAPSADAPAPAAEKQEDENAG